MSQEKLIANYCEREGSITALEAIYNLGITRLSARVYNLRKLGYNIVSEYEHTFNRYNEPVKYKRYYVKGNTTNREGNKRS